MTNLGGSRGEGRVGLLAVGAGVPWFAGRGLSLPTRRKSGRDFFPQKEEREQKSGGEVALS